MSLFIFAGEPSGDLHGEALVEKLRAQNIQLFGVGGPRMRAQGLETVMEMERFQVMGFVDVALAMPRIMRQFYELRSLILKRNPEVVLTIDYPGFNLAMAKSLRKKGYQGKICHYICPSVWAWGKKRIPKMESTLDYLFSILPFEKELFDPEKLDVRFVGHPLIKKIPKIAEPGSRPLVALFPGSRAKELDRNLDMQLKVAKRLDAEIAISIASKTYEPRIREAAKGLNARFVDSKDNYALMQEATVAIAKSGTITLELALHGVPTVMTYGLSKLDLWIARDLLRIRLPYYGLPNIILQEAAFPELIGPLLTEERLFEEASRFLLSKEARQTCREKCQRLHTILGNQNPADEIAATIKSLYRQT